MIRAYHVHIWLYTWSFQKFLAYWRHFEVQQCMNSIGNIHYINPIQVSSWLIWPTHLTLSSIAECNPVQTSAWLCWPTLFYVLTLASMAEFNPIQVTALQNWPTDFYVLTLTGSHVNDRNYT